MFKSSLRIHIFGMGRAGLSLARSAQQAGLSLGQLWDRSAARAQKAEQLLRCSVASGTLPLIGTPISPAATTDLVVLAVSDQAIAQVCAQICQAQTLRSGQVVAHLAGALGVEVLALAGQAGAPVGVLHPLRALDADTGDWRGAVCGMSGDPLAQQVLQQLSQALGCTALPVDDAKRGLYHAAAALAANDLLALFSLAQQSLEASGLPGVEAQRAVFDLMDSALQSARVKGPGAALTGAVARGDQNTLTQHLDSLGAFSAQAQQLHRVASLILVDLAGAQGLADDRAQGLRDVLAQSSKNS